MIIYIFIENKTCHHITTSEKRELIPLTTMEKGNSNSYSDQSIFNSSSEIILILLIFIVLEILKNNQLILIVREVYAILNQNYFCLRFKCSSFFIHF